jgi:DNA polymerase-3 subunit epsilon
VAPAAAALKSVAQVRDLPARLGMTVGRLDHDGYRPPKGSFSARKARAWA